MEQLTDYLYDIIQNSIKANAELIEMSIVHFDQMVITLSDNGCGMDEETLKKVTSPFYTTKTTRRVGIGLPLIQMLCEQTEGSFLIESKLGIGTSLHMTFNDTHIDMPPIGDLGAFIYDILLHQDIHQFVFSYLSFEGAFNLSIEEIKMMFEQTLTHKDIKDGLIAWINHEIQERRGKQ